jgi:hypothetical protein
MNILTINDDTGHRIGFAGVRAFVGCDDMAEHMASQFRARGMTCEISYAPLNELPERSKTEEIAAQWLLKWLDV